MQPHRSQDGNYPRSSLVKFYFLFQLVTSSIQISSLRCVKETKPGNLLITKMWSCLILASRLQKRSAGGPRRCDFSANANCTTDARAGEVAPKRTVCSDLTRP